MLLEQACCGRAVRSVFVKLVAGGWLKIVRDGFVRAAAHTDWKCRMKVARPQRGDEDTYLFSIYMS